MSYTSRLQFKETLALACALLSFSLAGARLATAGKWVPSDPKSKIDFTDSRGREWSRWVLQEESLTGTLLLVVENPSDHASDDVASQRVVYRKLFAKSESRALTESARRFSRLTDRLEREPSEATLDAARSGKNPIWATAKDQWTDQDELDYTDWYSQNVNTKILVGSGIVVDCADFAMTVRWIYAHDHQLPVANTLSGSGKLFGHWSTQAGWDNLKTDTDWRKDERFKVALKYMLKNSYTHSVIDDLYPVKLSRDWVTPGSVLLILYNASTGHTELINSLGKDANLCPKDECISVIYGNEPSAETAYKDQAYIRNLGEKGGGFLRWRWPLLSGGTWKLTPKSKMPGYSLEQYSQVGADDNSFQEYIYATIGLVISDTSRVSLAANSMFSQLLQRWNTTAMGYFMCSVQTCSPSSKLYDDFSTPSRDLRFRETQSRLLSGISQLAPDDPVILDLQNWLNQYNPVFSGPSFWAYMLNTGKISDLMSSDPTKSYFERWGVDGSAAQSQLSALPVVWSTVWGMREDQVSNALALCYPHGETTPVCDVHSTAVAALATDRLDESLRIVRRDLRALIANATQVESDAIRQRMLAYATSEDYCGQAGNQNCTIDDLIFTNVDAVEKMSSDPTAPVSKRYGF